MRLAVLCLAVAVAAPSFAQNSLLKGVSLRAGWFNGFEFDGVNPSRVRLKGYSLGADMTISQQPWTGSKQSLSLTGVFAGRQQSGGDADADVYRLLRRTLQKSSKQFRER